MGPRPSGQRQRSVATERKHSHEKTLSTQGRQKERMREVVWRGMAREPLLGQNNIEMGQGENIRPEKGSRILIDFHNNFSPKIKFKSLNLANEL